MRLVDNIQEVLAELLGKDFRHSKGNCRRRFAVYVSSLIHIDDGEVSRLNVAGLFQGLRNRLRLSVLVKDA